MDEGARLAAIGAAIDDLAVLDPALAQLVDLKFFCGFTFEEIGAMKGISDRTVKRAWEKARLFLFRTMRPDSTD